MQIPLPKDRFDRLCEASKNLNLLMDIIRENLVSPGVDGQQAMDQLSKALVSLNAELRNRDGIIRPADRSKNFARE
jgi:hypothetical protein